MKIIFLAVLFLSVLTFAESVSSPLAPPPPITNPIDPCLAAKQHFVDAATDAIFDDDYTTQMDKNFNQMKKACSQA
uniref:Uncharacterized protein n=1 Tax=Panagrolaimus sp. ES5 TaxID=591445 RepID=A0AC34F8Q4_9BILA